jgi:hypothetical protein
VIAAPRPDARATLAILHSRASRRADRLLPNARSGRSSRAPPRASGSSAPERRVRARGAAANLRATPEGLLSALLGGVPFRPSRVDVARVLGVAAQVSMVVRHRRFLRLVDVLAEVVLGRIGLADILRGGANGHVFVRRRRVCRWLARGTIARRRAHGLSGRGRRGAVEALPGRDRESLGGRDACAATDDTRPPRKSALEPRARGALCSGRQHVLLTSVTLH